MKTNKLLPLVLVAGVLGAALPARATNLDPRTPQSPETAEPQASAQRSKAPVPFYRSEGKGDEALVLVHGWASSSATWVHQFPDLASRARVLAIDLPGHGESEPPEEAYSMALFAHSVAAAMDDAGVRRGVIVGHSNGTPVALNFARLYPERTLAIVAVDGALRQVFTREQGQAMFEPFRGAGWKDVLAGVIGGMAGTLSDADREAVREMALATRHEAVIGGFEAAIDPDAWSADPIEPPLLLLLAAQPTWNDEYEAWVRERAPQVDYRVWDGAGHFLHMERPKDFREALEEFLAANELL